MVTCKQQLYRNSLIPGSTRGRIRNQKMSWFSWMFCKNMVKLHSLRFKTKEYNDFGHRVRRYHNGSHFAFYFYDANAFFGRTKLFFFLRYWCEVVTIIYVSTEPFLKFFSCKKLNLNLKTSNISMVFRLIMCTVKDCRMLKLKILNIACWKNNKIQRKLQDVFFFARYCF